MASLVFLAGPIAGRRFKLAAGEHVIGRRSDSQVFVPDMRVSRQHAKIVSDGEGWKLVDLGSNNGTFVNGNRVAGTIALHHEDEILIANNRIKIDVKATPSAPYESMRRATIIPGHSTSVIHSRAETDPGRAALMTSGLMSIGDQRELRLIERKLEALTQILHATAASDTPDALLEKIVGALLEVFPQAQHVGVLVSEEKHGELQIKVQKHRTGLVDEPLLVPGTIVSHVVSESRSVLLSESTVGEETIGRRMGAPLVYHGAHYGVVYVETKHSGFRQEDVDLLQSIATQAGLAIHAARVAAQLARRDQIERDLRMARQIQRSLLPAKPPEVTGLDFAVHYEPAHQIGGDFYDFIWHDPSHLGLCVGDVSGKAISAALYMARLTSELKSRAAIARTPARLLRRVNQEMVSLGDDGMFATLVYCMYDLEQRTITFTNAGHCLPLLRRDDHVFPLEAEKAHVQPLGVTPDMEAGEAKVQLHTGDMLIMVSDGIIEARDGKGNEYGLLRLQRRIKTARGGAEDIIKAILADVDTHTGGTAQSDDMTIVAMAIDARSARRKTTTFPGVEPPAEATEPTG